MDTAGAATNLAEAAVNFSLPSDVNELLLTGSADLMGAGNSSANIIIGNSGSDTLIAGGGVATLMGGAGNDTFVVDNTADVIQDTFGTTSNSVDSSVSYSLGTNVNVLALTGTAALAATANGAGDTLISNSGVDTLTGGAGNDLIVVNNAADVLVNISASDTVESSVSYSLPAGVNNIQLIGTANLMARGNGAAQTLTGGQGADTLVAGTGAATLVAGSGNDTFVVNSSADLVEDTSTTTDDSVVSNSSFSLPPNVDTLTLSGTANLTGTGNIDYENSITANSGADLIVGKALESTLTGDWKRHPFGRASL